MDSHRYMDTSHGYMDTSHGSYLLKVMLDEKKFVALRTYGLPGNKILLRGTCIRLDKNLLRWKPYVV